MRTAHQSRHHATRRTYQVEATTTIFTVLAHEDAQFFAVSYYYSTATKDTFVLLCASSTHVKERDTFKTTFIQTWGSVNDQ